MIIANLYKEAGEDMQCNLNAFRLQVGGNIRASGDLIAAARLGTSSTSVIYEFFMKTHTFVGVQKTIFL